jgi:hypothetical protein
MTITLDVVIFGAGFIIVFIAAVGRLQSRLATIPPLQRRVRWLFGAIGTPLLLSPLLCNTWPVYCARCPAPPVDCASVSPTIETPRNGETVSSSAVVRGAAAEIPRADLYLWLAVFDQKRGRYINGVWLFWIDAQIDNPCTFREIGADSGIVRA